MANFPDNQSCRKVWEQSNSSDSLFSSLHGEGMVISFQLTNLFLLHCSLYFHYWALTSAFPGNWTSSISLACTFSRPCLCTYRRYLRSEMGGFLLLIFIFLAPSVPLVLKDQGIWFRKNHLTYLRQVLMPLTHLLNTPQMPEEVFVGVGRIYAAIVMICRQPNQLQTYNLLQSSSVICYFGYRTVKFCSLNYQ